MKQSTLVASDNIGQSELAERARRRIAWRILPFSMLLYIVAYLDRVNVGYAKLKMAEELKFSDAVYGFGAGIFFIGYFLLEVPGTLIVERWSARLWISRIMITWGIVASLTGFIHTATQFHWIRFILGAAEAGFFPGTIVYLSHWFRAEDRGKAIALFMVAVPIASVVGAPLSGLIMERVHWLGIAGWRWVFILEGIPAVLCGIISIFYLTDRPHQAAWLEPEERDWISNALAQERLVQKSRHLHNYWMAMKEPVVVLLALAYFCSVTGMYGFGMWLPTLLKQFSGWTTLQVTMVAALPYLFALAGMLLVGWSSDRTRERIWHTALPMIIGSVAFLGSILWRDHLVISILMLYCGSRTARLSAKFLDAAFVVPFRSGGSRGRGADQFDGQRRRVSWSLHGRLHQRPNALVSRRNDVFGGGPPHWRARYPVLAPVLPSLTLNEAQCPRI